MKAILFPVIAIAGLCLSSCKSVQPVSNYQQQSQPQPQQKPKQGGGKGGKKGGKRPQYRRR